MCEIGRIRPLAGRRLAPVRHPAPSECDSLPDLCKIDEMVEGGDCDVAAVILAAGGSSRLGRPKQFLPWRGETLIRRIARTAADSQCRSVLIVAGALQKEIKGELTGIPSEVRFNPHWQLGLSTSIAIAVDSLMGRRPQPEGALFLTCDQPLISREIIDRLVEHFSRGDSAIVAAQYAGVLGIPALFARPVFPELKRLTGDRGARSVIEKDPSRVFSLPCPEAAIDIDNPQDWERTQRSLQQGDLP